MTNNLPPGVSDSMLPGNGPLDAVAGDYPETMSYDDIGEARARDKADADNDRDNERQIENNP